ncbi:uncharacterized protein EV420DRAFT_1696578 [Desarmillaria tabescens]|uniref:Alcohol oxidase n=1 Tax=Armillaria tabescens TaxID=1929756 RepID=A0AA39K3Q9_ARMTA|nr:uncharacterized protein EV420DRAFT_1696578 [Desarmillaria tabescens]KAK0454027.1 hypothetical protein EV420DRAFT_1696578 [Desarmillaria tabescens]
MRFFLLSLLSLSVVKFLYDFAGLDAYDFVVVGGGPGGSMVADRLSEDLTVNVLLLEVGGENDPATTIPQEELMAEIIWALVWVIRVPSTAWYTTRGSADDIDKWAELSGDQGWSWDSMLPYFKKGEKFNIIPRNGHNTTGQYLPAFHGTDGVIGSLARSLRGTDNRLAGQQMILQPWALSWMSANRVINREMEGRRSSAKAHLLRAENEGRENIDVLLHARVSRVVPTVDGMLDLRSVEVLDPADASNIFLSRVTQNLTAKNEIILSTGSVMTPTILHSGIGDPELLEPLSITTISSLPSVGKNLTDHIGIAEWTENKTGLLTDTSENHAAWLRLPDNSTMFDNYSDPSSGPLTAHYEFLFQAWHVLQNGLSSVRASGSYINVPTACVSPASRGSVSINSSDPFSKPLVDPALLTAPVDILIVLEPIKAARRFFSGPAWEGYILGSLNNNATTDEEIEEFIRENVVPFFHPVSTASMSPVGADWGVVDPDLKVKGASGLKVVDASVIPRLPAAHTSAPVYAVAERAADIIKAAIWVAG